MTFTVSFDPLHLIGIVFLAYLASLIGNVIATIIVAFRTPSLNLQRVYIVLGLLETIGAMTIPKIIIALIGSSVAMAMTDTTGVAAFWAMSASGAIGFLFILIAGSASRH